MTRRCRFGAMPQYVVQDVDELVSSLEAIETFPGRKYGVIFTPSWSQYQTMPYKWKSVPTVDVLAEDGKVFSQGRRGPEPVQRYALSGTYQSGKIYECSVDRENWLLEVRAEREDKTRPNSTIVVKRIISMVEKKICLTAEGLRGENAELFTTFHNRVKRKTLRGFNGTLLDVGSGTGGDVGKWQHFDCVHAVEPSPESFRVLLRRTNRDPKIRTYNSTIQSFDFGPVEKLDCLSVFFSANLVGMEGLTRLATACKKFPGVKMGIIFLDADRAREDADYGFAQLTVSGNTNTVTVKGTNVTGGVEDRLHGGDLVRALVGLGYSVKEYSKLVGHKMMSRRQKQFSKLYSVLVVGC